MIALRHWLARHVRCLIENRPVRRSGELGRPGTARLWGHERHFPGRPLLATARLAGPFQRWSHWFSAETLNSAARLSAAEVVASCMGVGPTSGRPRLRSAASGMYVVPERARAARLLASSGDRKRVCCAVVSSLSADALHGCEDVSIQCGCPRCCRQPLMKNMLLRLRR